VLLAKADENILQQIFSEGYSRASSVLISDSFWFTAAWAAVAEATGYSSSSHQLPYLTAAIMRRRSNGH